MKKLAFIFFLACSFFTCTKEEISSRPYPRVSTYDVQDITAEGAVLQGEIIFSNVPIIDHGFIWSMSFSMDLNSGNRVSLGAASGPLTFSAKIEDNLEVNQTYYVKAYAKSDQYTVYGEAKSFVSLGGKAPVLSQVTPASATWGDTIKLVGKNFNKTVATNQVYFDALSAKVLSGRADTLVCVVPTDLAKSPVTVKVSNLGNVGLLENIFSLKSPVITKVDPALGSVGTKVTITGKYLHPKYIGVKFNNITAKVISASATQVVVEVPEGLSEGAVPIKVNTVETLTTETTFQYKDPQVTSFTPATGTFGSTLTVKGSYLPTSTTDIEIYVDGIRAEIVSATDQETKFNIPKTLTKSECDIRYKYKALDITFNTKFKLNAPWVSFARPIKGKQIEITGRNFSPTKNEVYIQGIKANVISSNTNTIVAEYTKALGHFMTVQVVTLDMHSNSNVEVYFNWLQLTNFPWDNVSYPVYPLVVENSLYVMQAPDPGYGMDPSMYRYNASDASWTPISNPQPDFIDYFTFSIGEYAYCNGKGTSNTLKRYNHGTNTWTDLNKPPFKLCWSTAFPFQGKGYVIGGGDGACSDESPVDAIWEYTPQSDTWKKIGTASENFSYGRGYAVTDTAVYLNDDAGNLYMINPSKSGELERLYVDSWPTDVIVMYALNNVVYGNDSNDTGMYSLSVYQDEFGIWHASWDSYSGTPFDDPYRYRHFILNGKRCSISDFGEFWELD